MTNEMIFSILYGFSIVVAFGFLYALLEDGELSENKRFYGSVVFALFWPVVFLIVLGASVVYCLEKRTGK